MAVVVAARGYIVKMLLYGETASLWRIISGAVESIDIRLAFGKVDS